MAPTVSVVVTTRNEGSQIRHLLDSLLPQKHLKQVIVVDAASTDRTVEVCRRYEGRLPGLRIVVEPCTRGEGRNIGARLATGDLLCFTDGDCIVNAQWTASLVKAWKGGKQVLAGRTVMMGYWAFTKLHRVELPHKGRDTTWPSCNLAYPRRLFEDVGGFDPAFVTAEDIDLNFRAIEAGASIDLVPDAIVYARARESIGSFLRQAYWNGYGRKQLTTKHGRLWAQYSLPQMLRLQGGSLWGLMRMGCGFLGYVAAKTGRHKDRLAPKGGHAEGALADAVGPAPTASANGHEEAAP